MSGVPDPDLVIDVHQATVTRSGKDLIRAVDWRVELDERWVVLGPNGAGKTTLLNLAAARLHPSSGTVDVLGERLGRVRVFELRTRLRLATAASPSWPPTRTRRRWCWSPITSRRSRPGSATRRCCARAAWSRPAWSPKRSPARTCPRPSTCRCAWTIGTAGSRRVPRDQGHGG